MVATGRRSALGLMVLGILSQEPLHAYGIQRQLRQTGKERVVNIRQRSSVHQTIERLAQLGLIRIKETARTDRNPERTVYEITDRGRETATTWLREMLSEPDRQFPQFAAAISVVALLEPDDARRQLERRAEAVAAELADVEAELAGGGELPRLFQLEEEYRHAVLAAQLEWTRTVIDDLRSGHLSWTRQWLRELADKYGLYRNQEDPS